MTYCKANTEEIHKDEEHDLLRCPIYRSLSAKIQALDFQPQAMDL